MLSLKTKVLSSIDDWDEFVCEVLTCCVVDDDANDMNDNKMNKMTRKCLLPPLSLVLLYISVSPYRLF